jgi:hypothetical protein
LLLLQTEYFLLQSAKTNRNVNEAFFSIARDIKQRLPDIDSTKTVFETFSSLNSWTSLICQFIALCSWNWMSVFTLQPTRFRINKRDKATAKHGAQNSACCSWRNRIAVKDQEGGKCMMILMMNYVLCLTLSFFHTYDLFLF